MNKIILTLLMTILSTPAANAQNCVNSSRCDELGYTKTTTDCAGLDTLKCPFDENKVFCINSSCKEGPCKAGDILFSDMSCSAEQIPEKTAIGVVFSSVKRLAVALDEESSYWSQNDRQSIPTLDDCKRASFTCTPSGKNNTDTIIAYGKANNIEYPAAEYCNNYTTPGTKAGDWWLPSPAELMLLAIEYDIVSNKLRSLGKEYMGSATYYWSSAENGSSAFAIALSTGASEYGAAELRRKDYYTSYIRPVTAF